MNEEGTEIQEKKAQIRKSREKRGKEKVFEEIIREQVEIRTGGSIQALES